MAGYAHRPGFPFNLTPFGSIPGILDSTQKARVLRGDSSTLHFITFDPLTARGQDACLGTGQSTFNQARQPLKRIVVEVSQSGMASWRFVPSARREAGVETEGVWPRVIDICGCLVHCSEDQWDIYKLDPHYDCLVKQYPSITTVRHACSPSCEPAQLGKRPRQVDAPGDEGTPFGGGDASYGTTPPSHNTSASQCRMGADDNPRRKRANVNQSEETLNAVPRPTPTDPQQDGRWKRRERGEEKHKRFAEEQQERIRAREEKMWQDAMKDAPPRTPSEQPHSSSSSQPFGYSGGSDDFDMDGIEEEGRQGHRQGFIPPDEVARLAAIEESRRKMRELEADRPLWEQAARDRKLQEDAEQVEYHARAETRKHKQARYDQNVEGSQGVRGDDSGRARSQQQEGTSEQFKQTQDREIRRVRWMAGEWTVGRAFERFKQMCRYFDETRFSETCPLFSDDVPWPVLQRPVSLAVNEDISWVAVEEFFGAVKGLVEVEEYVDLVVKANRRFHPDRWRSRGLFKAVLHPEERRHIELAATVVSQALNPIWRELKASA